MVKPIGNGHFVGFKTDCLQQTVLTSYPTKGTAPTGRGSGEGLVFNLTFDLSCISYRITGVSVGGTPGTELP